MHMADMIDTSIANLMAATPRDENDETGIARIKGRGGLLGHDTVCGKLGLPKLALLGRSRPLCPGNRRSLGAHRLFEQLLAIVVGGCRRKFALELLRLARASGACGMPHGVLEREGGEVVEADREACGSHVPRRSLRRPGPSAMAPSTPQARKDARLLLSLAVATAPQRARADVPCRRLGSATGQGAPRPCQDQS